jgi:hypothetical protein
MPHLLSMGSHCPMRRVAMQKTEQIAPERKQAYERPTLTLHGPFGRVTAGRTGKREDGSGGRLGL